MDVNAVRTATGADLDALGAGTLDRVSMARGHGFDESDASYRRRLLATVVGAAAADAMGSMPTDPPPAVEVAPEKAPEEPGAPTTAPSAPEVPKAPALRTDGPTVEEWVLAGYSAKAYPPHGYAPRSTDDEVKVAIAAQEAAQSHIPHEDGGNGEQTGNAAPEVQSGVHGGNGESAPDKPALP